jgi:hypothetical protein
MDCVHIKEKFVDYLTGELSTGQISLVREHSKTCRSCRDELASLNEVWTRLGVLPDEAPSENLRKNFYEMLESHTKAPSAAQNPSTRKSISIFSGFAGRFFSPRPLAQPVLLTAFLIFGFSLGVLLPTILGSRSEVKQLRSDVQSMRQLVVLSMLERPSASERLEGVSWSNTMASLDRRTFNLLLHTLNEDPNVNVRLSSLDSLARFKTDPRVRRALIRSLPSQSSPMVQISLIDQIGPWRSASDISALRQLLDDPDLHPAVRQTALESLESPI